ncbi:MAG: hypothetical protein JXA42_05245 [Anaerolineales bacterium]|nr:hypothetical protein [Anaerolineales bacterium]
MKSGLRLEFLGGMQITRDGQSVSGFVSSKAQALVCYLAITGHPHLRPVLAGLLWGEMPEDSANINLRKALSNLRRLFPDHLIIKGQSVAFDSNHSCWLDVEAFRRHIECVLPFKDEILPAESAVHLAQAAALYQGDFLNGFYVHNAPAFEEWANRQRLWLRGLMVDSLDCLSQFHTIRGETARALDYTSQLLSLEPLRENAHQRMMRLLALGGRQSEALAQFEKCWQILD